MGVGPVRSSNKQGNCLGAKGLAGRPRAGTLLPDMEPSKEDNKTRLHDLLDGGEEVVLKSRMREICKSGSVRGLVVDSQRVGHEAYSNTLLNSKSVKASGVRFTIGLIYGC